jgi:predicted ABC-type ATPase
MFAGPNGSGKSTLKSYLPKELLGIYLNPDEIERSIRQQNILDLAAYGVTARTSQVLQFFIDSPLLIAADMANSARLLEVTSVHETFISTFSK